MPEVELDESDRRLLKLLQRDARRSTQGLAEAAGMSASPAWRRVKRLEEAGVITGQVAAPLFSLLRENEPEIRARDARALAARERAAVAA